VSTLGDFDITIASDIQREVLTAEVDRAGAQVAEILEGEGGLVVSFFPGPSGEWPTLPFEPLMEALREAARLLVDG
jgi:hypothetical protein